MAAVWFVLTVPTEQQQQKAKAQDRGKDKIEIENESKVTFQIPTRTVGLNEAFNNQQPDGDLTDKALRSEDYAFENILEADEDEPSHDTSMEQILQNTLDELNISNAVWKRNKSKDFYQVTFPADAAQCETVLQRLHTAGFGSKYSSTLSVLPCTLHYQQKSENQLDVEDCDSEDDAGASFKTAKQDFLDSIKSRLTVAQVVEGVTSSAKMTFDFISFIILAGFLAAIGLMENSSVILVASMLISPLMGPILAVTFGIVIRDRALQKLGIQNELIALGLCIIIGFISGIFHAALYQYSSNDFWLVNEMIARGQLRALWVGAFIALLSGAGVALSVVAGNAGSLVGVAISASLLPPAVNAGLLWGTAFYKQIECSLSGVESCLAAPSGYSSTYSDNMVIESSMLGTFSLTLTVINILCIVIMGVIVLKIKEVAPDKTISDTKRFWKEDIKNVRDYNRTVHPNEHWDSSTVLQRIRDEWQDHAQKTDNEKVQIRHKMRLQRVMSQLEDDPVYRTVVLRSGHTGPSAFETWHAPREGGRHENSRRGAGHTFTNHLPPTSPTPNKRRLTFSLFKPSRFTVTPATDEEISMSPTRKSRPLLE